MVLVLRVDRAVVTTVLARLCILAGGFVSAIVTTRWMSPTGRGQYFMAVTLAQSFAQFGNLGLQSSNTYVVARRPELAGLLVANSLWLAVLAGGAGSAVLLAVLGAIGSAPDPHVWWVVVLAPATLFYMLGTNLLVGLGRTGAFNVIQVAGNYFVLACLCLAAVAGAGPGGFIAASACGWLAVAVALLAMLRHRAALSMRGAWHTFLDGLRYALKAYGATLCGFLIARSNVFLLGALDDAEAVGYFSVATQVGDLIGILPQSIALVLFPTLVTAEQGRLVKTLKHLLAVAVSLSMGCLALGLMAEPFVRVVFGPSFAPAAEILRWTLPGALCLGLITIVSQYLAATGFPLSLVGVWLTGTMVALSAGAWLIPTRSAVGAAMALSLTYGVLFVAILMLAALTARRQSARRRTTAAASEVALS
jgi:O-antigen/teichoic acid export membrane protein